MEETFIAAFTATPYSFYKLSVILFGFKFFWDR